jgi:phosphatidylserine/phosphatidylglycerophosphate/cardiolipin synthase-like enzyme
MQIVFAAFAATVATCFAPEGNCALLAIGAIDAAQREILVNAYALTTVSGIPGALIRAHDRGVDVAVIAD